MTPFVRGFALASVLLGAFALYGMWFMQRPLTVQLTTACEPIYGATPFLRWLN